MSADPYGDNLLASVARKKARRRATETALSPEGQQELMRKAAAELMAVHSMTERTAASLMLTITSVVSLAPKQK